MLTAVDVVFAQAFLASPKGVMKAPKPPPTPPQGATPNSKRRLKGQGVADRETKLVLTAEEKLGELSHDHLFWLVCVAQNTTTCGPWFDGLRVHTDGAVLQSARRSRSGRSCATRSSPTAR